jgi:hypothetical protein
MSDCSLAAASGRSMTAIFETKLTDAFSTPGTAHSDFSTARAQLAHDMP